MTKNTYRYGFSLVEVLITFVILAILATVGVVGYNKWQESNVETEVRSYLQTAYDAMEKTGDPDAIADYLQENPDVKLSYVGKGSSLCVEAVSVTAPDVSYHIKAGDGNEPQTGTCPGDVTPKQIAGPSTVDRPTLPPASSGDPIDVVQASACAYSTLALGANGKVYAWGANTDGQLGDGGTTDHSIPVAVRTSGTPMAGKRIVSIECSLSSAYAIDSNGKVYAWGKNSNGVLGDGTTTDRKKPVAVKIPKGIRKISTSNGHVLALAKDGSLYAWGSNSYGQVTAGGSSSADVHQPVAVRTGGTALAGKAITDIAAGHFYSLVIADGKVYGWGRNDMGQLGVDHRDTRFHPVRVKTADTPMAGKTIKAVAAGAYTSLVLSKDGTVFGWGDCSNGQLGIGKGCTSYPTWRTKPVAVKIPADKKIGKIAIGWRSSLAVSGDGTLYSWGVNLFRQLGDGTTTNRATPVRVKIPAGKKIAQISVDSSHAVAVSSDKKLYVWGENARGSLGRGNSTPAASPVLVTKWP